MSHRSLSERDNIGGALVEEFVRATKASHMQDAVSMTVHVSAFIFIYISFKN